MSQVLTLNTETFNQTIKNGIVIVDIKTEWCGPCKTLGPIVEQVASDLKDKGVVVGKLDADDNGNLCQELGITNIPTLLFYKDGELKERTVGMKMKKEILNIVNKLIES